MPIYEYQCGACGDLVEALQKLSDASLVDCTQCGQPELKKRISASGFRLTGGGWYETDFKTGEKKKNLAGEPKKRQLMRQILSRQSAQKKPIRPLRSLQRRN
ncbi:zinc ribbon domain-containing protein [Litorivicinus sp.]|nr:zinc ribbon domain-containing protein [Litorivicinus sp.]